MPDDTATEDLYATRRAHVACLSRRRRLIVGGAEA